MQINLTGHHVELTEPLRDYVDSKFLRLKRHFDNVVKVHVVLTVEKLQHKAEANIVLGGGKVFAEAVNEDMYASIDELIDKLDRQVVRHKEKLTDHRRDEAATHRDALAEGDSDEADELR